ncbi:MAG: cobK [Acidimicrobiales bacterium]|nr:cobK [Acidimicrobiales bacterium]
MTTVLLLAGTSEATRLADALVREHDVDVLSSLAGVTTNPVRRLGRLRTGGFGGTDGLIAHLRQDRPDVIVDATHPFAAVMPHHVADASAATGIPSCRLLRPAWEPVVNDRWISVGDLPAAAAALEVLGSRRPLLTVGRQSTWAFTGSHAHVAIRAIDAPDEMPDDHHLILDRGPFGFDDELALLRDLRIDAVVTKNSGGNATEAKLTAARQLGLPVVMVERPAQPAVTVVSDVDHAVAWVAERSYQRGV